MEKDEINEILKNGLSITREDLEPTEEELIAEQAVVGWENIWRELFHARRRDKYVPYFCLHSLRTKHRRELLRLGVIFVWHEGRSRTPRICAWPTMVRRWLTAKSRLREL